MTTNSEAWGTVARYKDELNTNGRKIAFGGAALAWTLQTGGAFPPSVGLSLIFFVLFFVFDLVQLFVGYILRRNYLSKLEKKYKTERVDSLEADYKFYQDIDIWPFRLVLVKWALLSFAFIFLLTRLWSIVDPLEPLWKLLSNINAT